MIFFVESILQLARSEAVVSHETSDGHRGKFSQSCALGSFQMDSLCSTEIAVSNLFDLTFWMISKKFKYFQKIGR